MATYVTVDDRVRLLRAAMGPEAYSEEWGRQRVDMTRLQRFRWAAAEDEADWLPMPGSLPEARAQALAVSGEVGTLSDAERRELRLDGCWAEREEPPRRPRSSPRGGRRPAADEDAPRRVWSRGPSSGEAARREAPVATPPREAPQASRREEAVAIVAPMAPRRREATPPREAPRASRREEAVAGVAPRRGETVAVAAEVAPRLPGREAARSPSLRSGEAVSAPTATRAAPAATTPRRGEAAAAPAAPAAPRCGEAAAPASEGGGCAVDGGARRAAPRRQWKPSLRHEWAPP